MNDPKSVQEINLAIARALGVDTSNLRRLRLTLESCELPLLEATLLLRDGEGFAEVVTRYRLEPKYEPGQPELHLSQEEA